jgi:hypothetical protein
MAAAEVQTAGNTRLHLTIAASYGGRWDIAQAARSLAAMSPPAAWIPKRSTNLAGRPVPLADLPPPDLFIRTGGDTGSATSCCGSWPTPSCGSPKRCGRSWIAPHCERAWTTMPAASADSASPATGRGHAATREQRMTKTAARCPDHGSGRHRRDPASVDAVDRGAGGVGFLRCLWEWFELAEIETPSPAPYCWLRTLR